MRIDGIDEEVLLALRDSPKQLKEIGVLIKSQRIAKRRIDKHLRYGLIKRIRQGIYALSSDGKAYLKKLTPTIAVTLNNPKLEDLIDKLPTESHKAIFRLTLSGITAKLLLFKYFDNNWPASIILGPTKTFKTSLIEVLCKITKGLDFIRNNYLLYQGTPGDIGLRRFKTKGKSEWNVCESYLFKEKLASFDEWDKALPELKKIALSFADGRREFTAENKKIENHAYAVIMGNTTPKKLEIPDYIIRRSIVLNTGPLKDELKDNIDLIARDIFALLKSSKAPEIDLAKLAVPKTILSKEEFLFMRNLFMENVVEDYKGLVDTQPLHILSLGRLCLLGGKDIKEAIFQTVWDRLECLETMEGVKVDWRKRIRDSWLEYRSTDQPQIMAKIKVAEEREKKRKQRIEKTQEEVVRAKAERIEKQDLSFTNEKFTLIAKLRELRDELPRGKRWQNRCLPLKEQIKSLIERTKGVRNSQDLEVYQRILPGTENKQRELIKEIDRITDGEKRLAEEQRAKQYLFRVEKRTVKGKCKTLAKIFRTYAELTGGMGKEDNQQGERDLESLFYDIKEAKDMDSLISTRLTIEECIEDMNGCIVEEEARKESKKRKEEERKEIVKKEQEENRKLQAVRSKKRQVYEECQQDVFDSKYLLSQEKAELDILQKYREEKETPVTNITLFLEQRKLITRTYNFTPCTNRGSISTVYGNSYYRRFGVLLPLEVYLAVDNQVYPLNYFYNWDQVLPRELGGDLSSHFL